MGAIEGMENAFFAYFCYCVFHRVPLDSFFLHFLLTNDYHPVVLKALGQFIFR